MNEPMSIKVVRDENGGVLMILSEKVTLISFTPEAAVAMAHILLEKAQAPEERTPQ